MEFSSYTEAVKFIDSTIPTSRTDKFPGELGLARAKEFSKLIGSPEDKLRVIHVAGTSGKGSTAYFISTLLTSLGLKVGLSLSPFLIDFRERFQIDNQLIPKEKFLQYFNEILPAWEESKKNKYGQPSYFELLTALTFYIYHREGVDFAVMETGLGGLYDATNIAAAENKICVITKLDLDHTQILGSTVAEIAVQKAGIIHEHNEVITIEQQPSAQIVLEATAQKFSANLTVVRPSDFTFVKLTPAGTELDYHKDGLHLPKLLSGVRGIHQAENASIALAVVQNIVHRQEELGLKKSLKLDEEAIRVSLNQARFRGRFETTQINSGSEVILDGAHNPHKMEAFLKSLQLQYPGKKFEFLLAFKDGKDHEQMLEQIAPLASKIYLTEFDLINQDLRRFSVSPAVLEAYLHSHGFQTTEIATKEEAIARIIKTNRPLPLVITGSLYLLGHIYATQEVLK